MGIFEKIGYKDTLKPFDKRIPKTQLFLHGEFSKAERDLLTERVEEVRLCYVLNGNTYPMETVVNSEMYYDSISWVLVTLKRDVSIPKLSRIIQETLPSPTVILYQIGDSYLFSSALKRLNKNEKGKVVVEEYHNSGWINLDAHKDSEDNFLQSINLSHTPTIDYKQAYEHIHRRIYEVVYSEMVASIEADNFEELKAKIEVELARQSEIERLTKLINQKSRPLKEKMELAKKIKKITDGRDK